MVQSSATEKGEGERGLALQDLDKIELDVT